MRKKADHRRGFTFDEVSERKSLRMIKERGDMALNIHSWQKGAASSLYQSCPPPIEY